MKWFISLIISIAIYLGLGLIVWNIVFSCLDVNSMTLVALSNYRLATYSILTFVVAKLIPIIMGDSTDEGFDIFIALVVFINLIIAMIFNSWEGAWTSVNTIINVIYNIVNIGLMTCMIRAILGRNE
jgi:hypothetical protein